METPLTTTETTCRWTGCGTAAGSETELAQHLIDVHEVKRTVGQLVMVMREERERRKKGGKVMARKTGSKKPASKRNRKNAQAAAVKAGIVTIGGLKLNAEKVSGYVQAFDSGDISGYHKSMQTWLTNNIEACRAAIN